MSTATNPTTTPVYASVRAEAARLAISHKTLRRAVSRGEIPAYRAGRAVRLKPPEVDAWAAGQLDRTDGQAVRDA